jgi:hypothetical protein
MFNVGAPLAEVLDACNKVLASINNPFNMLIVQIPHGSLENYRKNTDTFITYLAGKAIYLDSFYLGKMLGDVIVMSAGLGLGVEGIATVVGGAGIGAAGTAGSGGLALVPSIAIAGVAVTTGTTMAVAGKELVMAAWKNYGDDKSYFDKL